MGARHSVNKDVIPVYFGKWLLTVQLTTMPNWLKKFEDKICGKELHNTEVRCISLTWLYNCVKNRGAVTALTELWNDTIYLEETNDDAHNSHGLSLTVTTTLERAQTVIKIQNWMLIQQHHFLEIAFETDWIYGCFWQDAIEKNLGHTHK